MVLNKTHQILKRFSQTYYCNRKITNGGDKSIILRGGTIGKGKSQNLKIGVLGAPLETGQPHKGVGLSPNLLRKMNLIENLRQIGHEVSDYGNLDVKMVPEKVDTKLLNPNNVLFFNSLLKQKVMEILKEGSFCLTLGGDHAIGIGTVSAHVATFQESACLLWVDAHADIHTRETTDSGHMHGMPVGFQIRELFESTSMNKDMTWHIPGLAADRIAYIGLRDVDEPEVEIMKRLNITSYYMEDVKKMGIEEVTKQALNQINPKKDRHIHISFDIDSLDPSEAPATGTPVPGGLTLQEGLSLLRYCFNYGRVSSMDMVEVNTKLGNEEEAQRTLRAAHLLILGGLCADNVDVNNFIRLV